MGKEGGWEVEGRRREEKIFCPATVLDCPSEGCLKADWPEFSFGKSHRWGLFPFFNIFPFTLIYQKMWGYCGAESDGGDKNEKEAKMPLFHNLMILLWCLGPESNR